MPSRAQQDATSTRIIFSNTRSRTEAPVPPSATGVSPAGGLHSGAVARTEAEHRLVRRVFARCDGFIQEACGSSSVPPEFLGALTAGESGGNPRLSVLNRLCIAI